MSGLVKFVSTSGGITEKIWAFNRPAGANATANINAYVKTEFTTVLDAGGNPSMTAIKDFTIDPNGNMVEIREYDWVPYCSVRTGSGCSGAATIIPAEAVLKRTTVTEYNNSAVGNAANAYWNSGSPNVRNAAMSTEVQDGNANAVSRSEMFYDSASTTANVIEVKVWDSTKGPVSDPLTPANSISTTTVYDIYGNPTLATDAKGNQTQITYGPINGYSGLYPTQTVSAYGTPIARTSTAVYDFYTGLVTTATDVDNGVSVMTEYDALGRPIKVRNAANSALESWVRTEYNDTARRVIVRSDVESIGDGRKVAIQHYDQLGRVRLSRSLENAATEDPYNETDGIKVETRYSTGNPNSYQITSNPFRAAYATQATSEPTMGWTRSKSWNTGRKSEVETFSGAALPAPWGTNAASTGIVTTDIDANATTVADQAGKLRRSIMNALGQMTRVDEPNGSNALGTVAVPNQPTTYEYDTLNNLKTVTQAGSGEAQCGPGNTGSCSQTRTFTYNSLSQLLSANNPESGLINYVYDNNGNLASKVDARGVKTDYVYDALNRVTNRNYSLTGSTPPNYQATPNVSYFYDNITNAKGKLIKVTNGTGTDRSTTEYTAFDILGRVTASRQTTDNETYGSGTTDSLMTYTYDLSGAMIEQQYPSGRKVQNVLDADGSLEMVKSRKNISSGYHGYANNFTYNAARAVTSMQLGNGRWESTTFNSRLQPTQIALGATQGATGLLDLDYTYGTTNNNGNVLTQTINVPTVGSNSGFVATQTYTYDSLNRLNDATEILTPTGGSATQTWKQTFIYDRYGNRTFDTTANRTTTIPTNCPAAVCNPSANASDNKLKSSDGYVFDNSGNTTTDAESRMFVYDAENKQVEVKNSVGQTVGQYFYDGDGKRIKKVVPGTGETTIFVYDAAGNLVAEYSTVVAPANDAKVAYLTNDHLGSPRINTDRDGNVIARHDYHPFGEEIITSQRTSGLSYADDTVRKQFTGYERDGESGLDFAQARYFGSSFGRFTSPDDFLNVVRPSLESQFNLYAYVNNNPLKFVDQNGQLKKKADGTIDFKETVDKNGKPVVVTAVIAVAVLKDGTRVQVVANYIQGTVTTDAGTKVIAQKFEGLDDSVKLVYTSSDGAVDKTVTVSPSQLLKDNKLDPTSNCFGKAFAQGEVWINNEKGSIAAIIDGDNYTRSDSPAVGDIGLYFKGTRSDGTRFQDVVHGVTVSTVDNKLGVSRVDSKNLGFLPRNNVAPGPGKGTAWEDTNTKLFIFSQKKSSGR